MNDETNSSVNLHDLTLELTRLSERDLRDWLRNVLLRELPAMAGYGADVKSTTILLQIIERSSTEQQSRICQAVRDLLDEISVRDSADYLGDLLLVAGLSGTSAHAESRQPLLRLAHSRKLLGLLSVEGEELHLRVLRVLAGISLGAPDLALFQRDFHDAKYTPLCFATLYLHDLNAAGNYCADLVRISHAHPEAFRLSYVLRKMLHHVGVPMFTRDLPKICDGLSDDDWGWLWTALSGLISVIGGEPLVAISSIDPLVYRPGYHQIARRLPLKRITAMASLESRADRARRELCGV